MAKTITFKSTPENWTKEYLGLKCNTLRKPDKEQDVRFEVIADYLNGQITKINVEIENTRTHEKFVRPITDITFFDGYFIISWSPFFVLSHNSD